MQTIRLTGNYWDYWDYWQEQERRPWSHSLIVSTHTLMNLWRNQSNDMFEDRSSVCPSGATPALQGPELCVGAAAGVCGGPSGKADEPVCSDRNHKSEPKV